LAERQYASVELSHRARYEFAAGKVRGRVLDGACGTGYGTQILANREQCVVGVDVSEDALRFARENYKCEFIKGLLEDRPWQGKFDSIVSFETLEHLEAPELVLRLFAESLNPGGLLIASVPNEDLYPFVPETFKDDEYPHKRHYTPDEFEDLLRGFRVEERYCNSKQRPHLLEGTEGRFLTYVCSLLP